jgi:hypothetical protein
MFASGVLVNGAGVASDADSPETCNCIAHVEVSRCTNVDHISNIHTPQGLTSCADLNTMSKPATINLVPTPRLQGA